MASGKWSRYRSKWYWLYVRYTISYLIVGHLHYLGTEKILVSADVDGSVGLEEWLMRFHGEKISFPRKSSDYPAPKFIGWHVREVFKGDYREL